MAAVKITYYGEKVKLGAGPLEIVGRTDQKNEGSTETVESVLKNLRMILEISLTNPLGLAKIGPMISHNFSEIILL